MENKIINNGYLVVSNIDLTNELKENPDQIILWQNFNTGDKFFDDNGNEYTIQEIYHNDGDGYVKLY